jgi:hypothetical protein
MFSRKNLLRLILVGMLSLALLAACNAQSQQKGNFATIPAGQAYADGKEIYFSHTEASDPAIAEKLTNMMKSPVLLVPSLAKAPAEMLGNVYVFENGVTGKGPLGFQPDVFDNPPGSSNYTPLRRIVLVNWKDSSQARLLKAAADVLQAESDGELAATQTDVVVNMPFMVWEGGQR